MRECWFNVYKYVWSDGGFIGDQWPSREEAVSAAERTEFSSGLVRVLYRIHARAKGSGDMKKAAPAFAGRPHWFRDLWRWRRLR